MDVDPDEPIPFTPVLLDNLIGRVQNEIELVLMRGGDVPAPVYEALEAAHGAIMAYWRTREEEEEGHHGDV